MNNPRYPFRLKLGFFLPQSVGYFHEFPFEYEKIAFNENFSLRNFEGNVIVSRTPQGLLLQGNFEGDIDLECVRCLKTYAHRLSWDMTELYAFSRDDVEDDALLLPPTAEIDIAEFVLEDAQLDIPINPICKEDCQGLCQVCGVDLNLEDCGHNELIEEEDDEEDFSDSPFAGLKDLR